MSEAVRNPGSHRSEEGSSEEIFVPIRGGGELTNQSMRVTRIEKMKSFVVHIVELKYNIRISR